MLSPVLVGLSPPRQSHAVQQRLSILRSLKEYAVKIEAGIFSQVYLGACIVEYLTESAKEEVVNIFS